MILVLIVIGLVLTAVGITAWLMIEAARERKDKDGVA